MPLKYNPSLYEELTPQEIKKITEDLCETFSKLHRIERDSIKRIRIGYKSHEDAHESWEGVVEGLYYLITQNSEIHFEGLSFFNKDMLLYGIILTELKNNPSTKSLENDFRKIAGEVYTTDNGLESNIPPLFMKTKSEFGFTEEIGTYSPLFDITTFITKIRTDPQFFEREGLLDETNPWSAIYKAKLKLIYEQGKISEQEFNEATIDSCKCNSNQECQSLDSSQNYKSNCESCGKGWFGWFHLCDYNECINIGPDCYFTKGKWYSNSCTSRFANVDFSTLA